MEATLLCIGTDETTKLPDNKMRERWEHTLVDGVRMESAIGSSHLLLSRSVSASLFLLCILSVTTDHGEEQGVGLGERFIRCSVAHNREGSTSIGGVHQGTILQLRRRRVLEDPAMDGRHIFSKTNTHRRGSGSPLFRSHFSSDSAQTNVLSRLVHVWFVWRPLYRCWARRLPKLSRSRKLS